MRVRYVWGWGGGVRPLSAEKALKLTYKNKHENTQHDSSSDGTCASAAMSAGRCLEQLARPASLHGRRAPCLAGLKPDAVVKKARLAAVLRVHAP